MADSVEKEMLKECLYLLAELVNNPTVYYTNDEYSKRYELFGIRVDEYNEHIIFGEQISVLDEFISE